MRVIHFLVACASPAVVLCAIDGWMVIQAAANGMSTLNTKSSYHPPILASSSSKFIRDDYSPWTALDVVRVSTRAMIRYL